MAERSPLYDATAAAGAVFAERAGWLLPLRFSDSLAEYNAACSQAALFDVSARGKIDVAGKDAASFLHNLSTNDIKSLAPGTGCEAFLATAKARTIAHVFIERDLIPDIFRLDSEPGTNAAIFRHLDRHLISEQVELTDVTADWGQLHLCGPQAKETLDRCLEQPLPDLQELHQTADRFAPKVSALVRRHDYLNLTGFDLFCHSHFVEKLWQLLTNVGAVPAGADAFDVLRVEGGQPANGLEMDENRFVVEVGRTRQAICYTKGCYLGQEPIVMARDRGHVNRTLLGLKLLSGGPAASGAKVLHNGQEVGQVTSSVVSPRVGMAIALAYLRRGSQEPGTVVEVEESGSSRQAQMVPLPFIGS